MVFPLIANVESSDRLDRLSLTEIIDRGQNHRLAHVGHAAVQDGARRPPARSSTSRAGGDLLRLRRLQHLVVSHRAPSTPFPPLPESTAADIDASIGCLCGFTQNLGSFLTPIKGALAPS